MKFFFGTCFVIFIMVSSAYANPFMGGLAFVTDETVVQYVDSSSITEQGNEIRVRAYLEAIGNRVSTEVSNINFEVTDPASGIKKNVSWTQLAINYGALMKKLQNNPDRVRAFLAISTETAGACYDKLNPNNKNTRSGHIMNVLGLASDPSQEGQEMNLLNFATLNFTEDNFACAGISDNFNKFIRALGVGPNRAMEVLNNTYPSKSVSSLVAEINTKMKKMYDSGNQ